MMGLMLSNDNTWMRTIKLDRESTNAFEIFDWCDKHCTGEWTSTPTIVAFENEADAVFFKLSFKL